MTAELREDFDEGLVEVDEVIPVEVLRGDPAHRRIEVADLPEEDETVVSAA